MMYYGGSPFWEFGGLFMIVFWAFIIFGIVMLVKWAVRESNGGSSFNGSHNNALEILKERYAKGEIDKNEFEDKKKDLA